MKFYLDLDSRLELSTTSKGNQTKWFYKNKYIKADTMGYESIAETIVSEFLKYVSDIEYVDYSLCTVYEKNKAGTYTGYEGCYSESFLSRGESCVSVWRLLELAYKDLNKRLKHIVGKEYKDFVVSSIKDITGIDIDKYLYTILVIDALTLNEDRHLHNIDLVETSRGYRLAPIFDNGLSLLSDTTDYPLVGSITLLMSAVKAKPFNRDFMKQVAYFDYGPLIIDFKSFENNMQYKSVDFKEAEFKRALAVLKMRLQLTEGKLWLQK